MKPESEKPPDRFSIFAAAIKKGLKQEELVFLRAAFYKRPQALAYLLATRSIPDVQKLILEIKAKTRKPETIARNLGRRIPRMKQRRGR